MVKPFMFAALLFAVAAPASAAPPPELRDRVQSTRPAGCADYRFLLFRIYHAELWTDSARLPGRRFALSLTYRRRFTRAELIRSSIAEMARLSGRPEKSFGAARAELEKAMRTVRKGDRYTAWRSRPDRVEFFHNGRPTGALTQDGDLFLAIWLSPQSRAPKPGAALLAGRCDG